MYLVRWYLQLSRECIRYLLARTLPGLIFLVFSHIYMYVHFYCEGGFDTPTNRLHPLTQKPWFIKDMQLKALHQCLKKHANTTINMVTLARHMNVSIKMIEHLHLHIRCILGMLGVHQQLVNIFEDNLILCRIHGIHVFIQYNIWFAICTFMTTTRQYCYVFWTCCSSVAHLEILQTTLLVMKSVMLLTKTFLFFWPHMTPKLALPCFVC